MAAVKIDHPFTSIGVTPDETGKLPSGPQADALAATAKLAQTKPWKSTDHPEVAAWLTRNEESLSAVARASELPRYFLPLLQSEPHPVTPTSSEYELPPISGELAAARALLARAMLAAGEGHLDAALRDLATVRRLARLLSQEKLAISGLAAQVEEKLALQAYDALLTSQKLNAAEVAAIKKQIESMPPLPNILRQSLDYEELLSLHGFMWRLSASRAAPPPSATNSAVVDTQPDADLMKADWDVMLTESHRKYDWWRATAAKPLAEALKAIDAKAAQDMLPGFVATWMPKLMQQFAEYLKMRPGETAQTYGARVGASNGVRPASARAVMRGQVNCEVTQTLSLLAADLVAFRLVRGAYPQSLARSRLTNPQGPFQRERALTTLKYSARRK